MPIKLKYTKYTVLNAISIKNKEEIEKLFCVWFLLYISVQYERENEIKMNQVKKSIMESCYRKNDSYP